MERGGLRRKRVQGGKQGFGGGLYCFVRGQGIGRSLVWRRPSLWKQQGTAQECRLRKRTTFNERLVLRKQGAVDVGPCHSQEALRVGWACSGWGSEGEQAKECGSVRWDGTLREVSGFGRSKAKVLSPGFRVSWSAVLARACKEEVLSEDSFIG